MIHPLIMPKYCFNRLECQNVWINMKSTDFPYQISEKLNISKSTLFDCVDILGFPGAKMNYSYNSRVYGHINEGHFNFLTYESAPG